MNLTLKNEFKLTNDGDIREITYSCEGWTDTWVFDCGWRIKGSHPYRMILFGEQILDQPIGIIQFYKETGILPPKSATKKERRN